MPNDENDAGAGRFDGRLTAGEIDVRAIATLGVAWALFGLTAAVLFMTLVAPTLGATFVVESEGRGRSSSLEVATQVLSVVQLVGAALGVIACVIIALMAKRATTASVGIPALVSVVTPLLVALVSVNVLSPVGSDGRALSALVGMVLGAVVGGASFALVAFSTRRDPARL